MKKSVDRNRIRRIVRSSFFKNELILKKFFNKKIYVIIYYKSSIIHKYKDIDNSIKNIFNSKKLLLK
ncbi:ribonuclease P protein component [Blattabacterium cuenoti]|uniref:ribonuclease P protein component n=1 Tax=Blattabacterium cuenoti TaxID=1653831 RepID=UPI00163CA245